MTKDELIKHNKDLRIQVKTLIGDLESETAHCERMVGILMSDKNKLRAEIARLEANQLKSNEVRAKWICDYRLIHFGKGTARYKLVEVKPESSPAGS